MQVQEVQDGEIGAGELDHGLDVRRRQVMGGPNGDREGERLIQQLEQDLGEHGLH